MPEDVPYITNNLLSTLRKRAKGSTAYSILCKKYFYEKNIANFQAEFFKKQPKIYKLFFEQTILHKPLVMPKDFQQKLGIENCQLQIIKRVIDQKMDTFYCKNILEINDCSPEKIKLTLENLINGNMETAEQLFSIMSKPEKTVSQTIVEGGPIPNKVDTRIKRGIIKKTIYFEKIIKNCENFTNIHII